MGRLKELTVQLYSSQELSSNKDNRQWDWI